MGGRAFLTVIQGASFPRMTPETYSTFKAQHLAQLEKLFRLVGVPREAPEKETHGDIDFVVCSPLQSEGRVRAEDMKNLFKATKHLVDNHNHSVNLAIAMGDHDGTFYQVDINECDSEEEWNRVMFFHSYGDLGIILGVLARHSGLSLGLHGLKVPHSAETGIRPFLLSADHKRIMEFFGLDLGVWEAGFLNVEAMFQWVASSWLFRSGIFQEPEGRLRQRDGRGVYRKFLEWAAVHGRTSGSKETTVDAVGKAKEFFGKTREYEECVKMEERRRRVKEVFNGRLVMEWTGLYGLSVREVMEGVRARVDEDTICGMSHEEMRLTVLDVAKGHMMVT